MQKQADTRLQAVVGQKITGKSGSAVCILSGHLDGVGWICRDQERRGGCRCADTAKPAAKSTPKIEYSEVETSRSFDEDRLAAQ
jgi:hypothetical protein